MQKIIRTKPTQVYKQPQTTPWSTQLKHNGHTMDFLSGNKYQPTIGCVAFVVYLGQCNFCVHDTSSPGHYIGNYFTQMFYYHPTGNMGLLNNEYVYLMIHGQIFFEEFLPKIYERENIDTLAENGYLPEGVSVIDYKRIYNRIKAEQEIKNENDIKIIKEIVNNIDLIAIPIANLTLNILSMQIIHDDVIQIKCKKGHSYST